MNIKPYSKYKPSGIEWFGALPSHWVVKRLRFATERIEQGWSPQCDNQAADDDAWGVMKVGCVNGDQFDASENKALPPELDPKTEYELRPGDVLISRANTRELVGSAAIVPSDVRSKLLLCDKLFRIALSPEVDAAYLTFCLRTRAARFQYEQDATGASGSMQNIGQDAIKNLVFPFPSYAEQQQIAAFLDWKTDQIDALIAKKQALLQKLKEKRLAVITQAVTKGLNPDAPMRDSGIAWLGEVPTHWEVKRHRFGVQRIEQGWSPQCDNQPAEEDEWGVMKVGCVNGGAFNALENKALPPELIALAEYELQPKDILISRANTKELLGSAAIVPLNVRSKLLLCDKLFRLRPEPTIDEEFLTCYLRTPAARYQYEREATGASGSMQNIGQSTLKNLVLPLPPLDEQRAIFEFIQIETSRLDNLMNNAESAITRLTEYRSALITAATTGKIDVRSWQAPQETV